MAAQMDPQDWERLKADYSESAAHFRVLADVRFKLLAIAPALVGLGFGTLAKADATPQLEIGLGSMGWLVTVGLIAYELRNTQLYDATRQRLQTLEARMGFPSTHSADQSPPGGVHLDRPSRMTFRGVLVFHDRALAIIYGTSLGGWTYLVANGVARRVASSWDWCAALLPVALAVVVGVLVYLGFHEHDQQLEPLRRLMPEVTAPGADQSSTPPGQEAPPEPLAPSAGDDPSCLLLPCRGCPCPSQNRPSTATSGTSSIAASVRSSAS